jgi:hypothetical protein
MSNIDDHIAIFTASEQLDSRLKGLQRAVYRADMYPDDMAAILIWVAGIEATADGLREHASMLAETQP